jgi:hypothetical protein
MGSATAKTAKANKAIINFLSIKPPGKWYTPNIKNKHD